MDRFLWDGVLEKALSVSGSKHKNMSIIKKVLIMSS